MLFEAPVACVVVRRNRLFVRKNSCVSFLYRARHQAKTNAMDARLEAEESGECAPTNLA